ncbi:MAG: PLP-dependent aminotransferase family protein [Slackia sp.]|nr:PLP-dependent aminotransferase family protein [Slackia sp.]
MLDYDMTQRREDPLYAYLGKCIKRDIDSGAIDAHEKLPSKRALARNLGIGVITVEAAYEQLIAEGYLYAERHRGYFACDVRPDRNDATSTHAENASRQVPAPDGSSLRRQAEKRGGIVASSYGKAERTASRGQAARAHKPEEARRIRFDFSFDAVPSSSFPLSTWIKTLRDTMADEDPQALLAPGDPNGTERLRIALSDHLRRTRDLAADPARIVIGAGAQTLYDRIAQLLGKDAVIALEDPGDPRLARIYEMHGIRIVSIGLDEDGIDAGALRASPASAAHIAPSHQFPTGASMPASRRYELLAWASERPDRYIIEDDRDDAFRLAGKPLAALKSIDENDCVIHVGTFEHVLGPSFRIAYMVLPARLARVYRETMHCYSCTVSTIDQFALARFIEQKDLEHFIGRTKTRCRNARNALMEALEKTPSSRYVEIEHADAGLYLVLRVSARNTAKTDRHASAAATRHMRANAIDRTPFYPPSAGRKDADRTSDSETPCDLQAATEERIAASLVRQDVIVEPLSRFRTNAGARADAAKERMPHAERFPEATDERIVCRFALNYAALPRHEARAAAEAIHRGLAAFL